MQVCTDKDGPWATTFVLAFKCMQATFVGAHLLPSECLSGQDTGDMHGCMEGWKDSICVQQYATSCADLCRQLV